MVRTRFAPSPTGYLHVGGLRTALYSYLYARQHRGQFLLRIEDTDQTRFVVGAVEHLIETLAQVGIDYDEGPHKDGAHAPYIQSQRTELYRQHAQILLEKKAAYRCFCTPERLEAMRQQQAAKKQAPMYDRTCYYLSEEEVQQKLAEGLSYVIRQKIPHGRKLQFHDLIRDVVNFNTSIIDDQVLMKSDNFPTYHLANVVDDHLMEITHVIRGEEWLPSTPKHILLYEAFEWEPPQFAHLPLLLNKDKSKLSKRQGDVSVESYLSKGYSKDALLNFVALLGWHPGEGVENEIFSLEEMIKLFSLEKVHKAGAVFDLEKLNWFNFQWNKRSYYQELEAYALELDSGVQKSLNDRHEPIFTFSRPEFTKQFQQKQGELLLNLCKIGLEPAWLDQTDLLYRALITVQEKVFKTPSEVAQYVRFYFEPKDPPFELFINDKMKVTQEIAIKALEEAIDLLNSFDNFEDMQLLHDKLLNLVVQLGWKNGQLLWPLRVALSSEQYSPGVFELLWALGKNESFRRLEKSLQILKKGA